MFLGLNGALEHATKLEFANGWAIVISRRACDHIGYMIVPAYMYHEEYFECSRSAFARKIEAEMKLTKSRGDLVTHFDGDDEAIFQIIANVRNRPPHESVAIANSMLSGVVKK